MRRRWEFLVEDLPAIVAAIERDGCRTWSDQSLEGHHRIYLDDNRIEMLGRVEA